MTYLRTTQVTSTNGRRYSLALEQPGRFGIIQSPRRLWSWLTRDQHLWITVCRRWPFGTAVLLEKTKDPTLAELRYQEVMEGLTSGQWAPPHRWALLRHTYRPGDDEHL